MAVIILLIIFSVLVAAGFLVAFIWAVRSGQYDDTDSPAVRMLLDEKNNKGNRNPGKINSPAVNRESGKQETQNQQQKPISRSTPEKI